MTNPNEIERNVSKTLVAVLDNQPTTNASVVLCDATAMREQLVKLLRRDVKDITPEGYIEIQKRTVQIGIDITRKTAKDIFKGLIRAVIVSQPDRRRIGVICHSTHTKCLKELERPFQSRIVKIAYFGSGEDRSSNQWFGACDLLIVAGTPRVSPDAIRLKLFQMGEIEAASREPEWGLFRWRGLTESGAKIIIDGRGYAYDSDWRDAQRSIVRANIVQAVGRGRGILPDGCEVILLSTEESGILLATDQNLEPMTEAECTVFTKIAELTAVFPINNIIERTAVNSPGLATLLQIKERQVRTYLDRLERRGLIVRVGQRKGWTLSDAGLSLAGGGSNG